MNESILIVDDEKEIADLEIKRQSEIFKEYGFESIEDLENFLKQNRGN